MEKIVVYPDYGILYFAGIVWLFIYASVCWTAYCLSKSFLEYQSDKGKIESEGWFRRNRAKITAVCALAFVIWFMRFERSHDRNAAARQTLDHMIEAWSVGLKQPVTTLLTEWTTEQKPWDAVDEYDPDY